MHTAKSISKKASDKGLKINDQKTQLLSVSSAFYNTRAIIKDNSGAEITSSESLKMLGYTFSTSLSVQPQLDSLMRKANKRFFLLRHYKRSGVPKDKLKEIFCAMNRSILEYSSKVYHSMLNIGQSNELEKIQKRCLRIIYGFEFTYKQLLEKAGFESLKDRRERQFAKFAKKASENDKYKHWFPKNPTERITRKTLVYKEEKATGNRLYNSPIFAMRRLLNNSQSPLDNVDLTGLFNMP